MKAIVPEGMTMPVTSEWYNEEKTIMYIKYDGHWTLDDYYKNYAAANELMRSVSHDVVAIADFSNSGRIPVQFLTVGSHAEQNSAPNNVKIIIFGIDRYMEILAKMFQRLFPKATATMALVTSLEEALEVARATLGNGSEAVS